MASVLTDAQFFGDEFSLVICKRRVEHGVEAGTGVQHWCGEGTFKPAHLTTGTCD